MLLKLSIMDRFEIANKAQSVITPVVVSLGYSVVDCEYINDMGRWALRVFIEKSEGNISIDDCERVSRMLEGLLDVEDIVPTRYVLEVSSPGLNRPLKKAADFVRFKGKKIRLRTKAPIDGRSNYFGVLLGMAGDEILMNVDNVEYHIPIEMLMKANLEFELVKQRKR